MIVRAFVLVERLTSGSVIVATISFPLVSLKNCFK